ncbi:Uncharacterised protein [Mycobacteroides abscessus subsp. massiliense]|nr:Uncharacterised protein [Mycobacteroides abscessus subsp. massiliense]SKV42528.1 Uncharacterised protein [Mycobacteroides abscessus subsp. massiliense]
MLPQRNRACFVDHHRGVPTHRLDPATELLGIADRGRQTGQRDVLGKVQNHLFPHRTAEPVGQEMHLVHHDVGKAMQCGRIRVQHVAQYLGGHHHHRSIRVDRRIAREQADLLGPVDGHQIVVLLVAQGLDRGGVEALAPRREGQVHREFPDDGLTRAGGRADQHTMPVLQRSTGAHLKRIEREAQPLGERAQLRRRDCGQRSSLKRLITCPDCRTARRARSVRVRRWPRARRAQKPRHR